jgi:hypothetical protein
MKVWMDHPLSMNYFAPWQSQSIYWIFEILIVSGR